MAKLPREKVEYGDFQTPPALAAQVAEYLRSIGEHPNTILEPTCGAGSFLISASRAFPSAKRVIGFDINPSHIELAKLSLAQTGRQDIELRRQDFFDVSWRKLLREFPSPVLVLGNPPWVTASELGEMKSGNLPAKSNFQKLGGLEAKMGRANFDIAEYMLIRLAQGLSKAGGTLAMLVKTSVARRFLEFAWTSGLKISPARILTFDSAKHFSVSAPACLLYCQFGLSRTSLECEFLDLDNPKMIRGTIGWRDDQMFADVGAFTATRQFAQTGSIPLNLRWRSGIKHDCASVMELRRQDEQLLNGQDRCVDVEDEFLFPLIKGTALAAGHVTETSRLLLVPQRRVGESTDPIQLSSPRTWRYLMEYAEKLDARLSSIYRNQPRFSIFGVGVYTFRPFKIAISALHKKLCFQFVGPIDEKPVAFDDTVNFLSFDDEPSAKLVKNMLDSKEARKFLESRIFWDNKRPITTRILGSLDLRKLAAHLGHLPEFDRMIVNSEQIESGAISLF